MYNVFSKKLQKSHPFRFMIKMYEFLVSPLCYIPRASRLPAFHNSDAQ